VKRILFFRKAGFDAIQKKAQENQKKEECKKQQQQQQQQQQQYGAWGPVFKNKQHFVNMHIF
jgi:N-acetylglutamate synthase-like GNAT family acetyltransferase